MPDAELFERSAANGIAQIVWSSLAQGVLTGKHRPGEPPPADSRAASDDMSIAMGPLRSDEALGRVPVTQPTLAQAGVTHRWSLPGASPLLRARCSAV